MERAGIQRADLVVAVTGDDEDNLLICQVAKEKYLCERIIARVNNPRNLDHFKLLGIQPAVSATDLILRLIEHEVPRYGLVHLLDLPEERLEIIELVVSPNAPAAGRAIADIGLPEGSLVISVLRGGSGFVPKADTVVEAGDEVLVVLDPGIEDDITAVFVGDLVTRKAPFPYHSPQDGLDAAQSATPRSPANKGHPSALGPVGIAARAASGPLPREWAAPPFSSLSGVPLERDDGVIVDRALSTRLGRSAEQEPAAVGAALHLAAGDELAQGGGDGRATRADHAGQRAVREAQAHDHATGRDAAPALGQAPQQREQTVVHAREVGDGLHDHEPFGAAGGPLDERREDLRPLSRPNGQSLIDHGEAHLAQGAPLDAAGQQDLGVTVVPGP